MKFIKALSASFLAGVAFWAPPASAASTVGECNPQTDLSVTASACSGWYKGNLLNNDHKPEDVLALTSALSSIGLNWDGNWSLVDPTKVTAQGNVFDFAGVLNGDVWIGIYQGGGGDLKGTGFFRLNATDLDKVALNYKGASSAVVFAQHALGGVPEPGTWAMLLLGFGFVGVAMRRRRVPALGALRA